MTLSEELTWRGLVNQTTITDLSQLDKNPVKFYLGVDPSAASMTVGNLAAMMLIRLLKKYGHQPVLLIGGATGLVGDPDGKKTERDLIDQAQLNKNKQAIVDQYKKLFGNKAIEIVDNYDWIKNLSYIDFLRTVGKHVPMRQMLGREFIQTRLGETGSGISYAEFSYVLIQAYDFLYLNQHKNVTLQVCGSDQWGNSIAGVDLIRRMSGQKADVLSMPLVVDQATGQKFGKSEAGAIWLDPAKTTPTQFYQFWMNINDADVESYLKIFTELSEEQIKSVTSSKPGERAPQKLLAQNVTTFVHGAAATQEAETVTEVLIGQKSLDQLDKKLLEILRQEIPAVKVTKAADVIEVLVSSGLASSRTEARSLLAANAVSLNGHKLTKAELTPSDFINGRALIRRGKAYKDSALVETN